LVCIVQVYANAYCHHDASSLPLDWRTMSELLSYYLGRPWKLTRFNLHNLQFEDACPKIAYAAYSVLPVVPK